MELEVTGAFIYFEIPIFGGIPVTQTMVSFLLVSLDKVDFTTGFTAVLACFNNIGPGLAAVGPSCNYAHLSDLSKVVLSLDMLAGRLEIFPILMLLSKSTWKK